MTLTKQESQYQELCDQARTGGRPISADQIFVSDPRGTPELFTPFNVLDQGETPGSRALEFLNQSRDKKPGGGNDEPKY
jgi:hypothetical protein